MNTARKRDSLGDDRASAKQWAAVTSVAMGTFALVTTEFLPVGLLTDIVKDLKVSEGTGGLLVTMPGVMAALTAPLLTVAAGTVDRRKILWLLAGIIALSNAMAAIAPSFTVIVLARVLLGVGVGGFWAFAAGVGVRLVPSQSAGRATAVILAGISVGTVLGVPAGALIAQLSGWRYAFIDAGLFATAVLIGQVALLPRLPVERSVDITTLPRLFRIPLARTGLIATVLLIAGHFAAYTYLRPLLEQTPGIRPGFIAGLLLVYGVAGFFGNFIGEAAIRRSLKGALSWAACAIGVALSTTPLIVHGPVSAFALVIVWGTAFGAVPLCLQTWMMRAAPDSEGGLALFISVFQLALAFGSASGGVVVNYFGIYSALIMGAVLCLATGAVVYRSKRIPLVSPVPLEP